MKCPQCHESFTLPCTHPAPGGSEAPGTFLALTLICLSAGVVLHLLRVPSGRGRSTEWLASSSFRFSFRGRTAGGPLARNVTSRSVSGRGRDEVGVSRNADPHKSSRHAPRDEQIHERLPIF